jgi:hypothetical protein
MEDIDASGFIEFSGYRNFNPFERLTQKRRNDEFNK